MQPRWQGRGGVNAGARLGVGLTKEEEGKKGMSLQRREEGGASWEGEEREKGGRQKKGRGGEEKTARSQSPLRLDFAGARESA